VRAPMHMSPLIVQQAISALLALVNHSHAKPGRSQLHLVLQTAVYVLLARTVLPAVSIRSHVPLARSAQQDPLLAYCAPPAHTVVQPAGAKFKTASYARPVSIVILKG
jgi:hypothetical protein